MRTVTAAALQPVRPPSNSLTGEVTKAPGAPATSLVGTVTAVHIHPWCVHIMTQHSVMDVMMSQRAMGTESPGYTFD